MTVFGKVKHGGCDRSGQLQEIRRNLRKLLLMFDKYCDL
ncbi:hypothetical protein CUZ95_0898 [Enterococcus lactis]|nr:hypothetical protein [Enterococcus lactis]